MLINKVNTKELLTIPPRQRRKKIDRVLICTKNTEFQEYKTEVQVLNTTTIARGYAGHDPQRGTSDGSF